MEKRQTFPWSWLAGGATIVVFLVLLAIRLDLFHAVTPVGLPPVAAPEAIQAARESWMLIRQRGGPIGYAHRVLSPREGGYYFSDEVFMRITTLGVVQGLTLRTRGTLAPDMTLDRFEARLTSNMFQFAVRGVVEERRIVVFTGEGKEERRHELALKERPHVSANVVGAALKGGLKAGETKILEIFDPTSMATRPVAVSVVGLERIEISGQPRNLTRMAVHFMGMKQSAWLDENGRVVREEGLLGIVLEETDRETARGVLRSDTASGDMTELASVASNRILEDPESLHTLRARLSGVDQKLFDLHGGRQTLREGVLEIRRENLDSPVSQTPPLDPQLREAAMRSTPFVQADAPVIAKTLASIVSPGDRPVEKSIKIVRFVYGRLEKKPVLSVANAVETLEKGRGDCTEHAALTAALGRAAGIPTAIETGLVYQRGRFYYHAWNAFWLSSHGQWVTADPTFNQFPADVTHIRFVRGEAQEQLDILGLLGKLAIEVLP